jgi:hypothetical protein
MYGAPAEQVDLKDPDDIDKDRDDKKTDHCIPGCDLVFRRSVYRAGFRVFAHTITPQYRLGLSSSDV